jgi:hypothetical protein
MAETAAPQFYEYVPGDGEEDISRADHAVPRPGAEVPAAAAGAGAGATQADDAPSHFAELAAFLASVAVVAAECDAQTERLSALLDDTHTGDGGIAARAAAFAASEAATDHEDPGPGGVAERNVARILDLYQEQASLLDTDLETMIAAVLAPVQRALDAFDAVLSATRAAGGRAAGAVALLCIDRPLRLMYHLCKVRGAKTVRRFLPHEARDLEPLVALTRAVDTAFAPDTTTTTTTTTDGAAAASTASPTIATAATASAASPTTAAAAAKMAVLHARRWQTRYCLMMWLSIVVMVPFDLESIDSDDGPGGQSVIGAIVALCERHLGDAGRTREAAAELVARLTTRPDMRAEHLERFTRWCVTLLERDPAEAAAAAGDAATGLGDGLIRTGIFAALASVFEYGHRNDLLPLMPALFPALERQVLAETSDIALRKLHAKVTQRMGLIFLQPRVAPWRYQRGSRSLVGNLRDAAAGAAGDGSGGPGAAAGLDGLPRLPSMGNTTMPFGVGAEIAAKITVLDGFGPGNKDGSPDSGGASSTSSSKIDNSPIGNNNNNSNSNNNNTNGSNSQNNVANVDGDDYDDDDDDDVDVPEEIESILHHLLLSLGDRDTVVRWSAAKGLGRLTNRLPLALADDVVLAVVGLLAPTETDAHWHGACLALAELTRRGLLLPNRLADAVPAVCEALHYDVRRGAHSVGAHVRDAACYVSWSLARALRDPRVFGFDDFDDVFFLFDLYIFVSNFLIFF